MRPDKRMIEPRFLSSITNHVVHGIRPGQFLAAVLENDLREAFARGDDAALENLPHILAFLVDEAPAACWGSPLLARAWAKDRRYAREHGPEKAP